MIHSIVHSFIGHHILWTYYVPEVNWTCLYSDEQGSVVPALMELGGL